MLTLRKKRLEIIDLGLCKLLSASKVIAKFQELDKSVFSKKIIFKNIYFSCKFRTYLTQTKTLYL